MNLFGYKVSLNKNHLAIVVKSMFILMAIIGVGYVLFQFGWSIMIIFVGLLLYGLLTFLFDTEKIT
jgi:hypothetical protein